MMDWGDSNANSRISTSSPRLFATRESALLIIEYLHYLSYHQIELLALRNG